LVISQRPIWQVALGSDIIKDNEVKYINIMEFKKLNKQSGEISRALLVIAIVTLIIIVIVYLAVKISSSRSQQNQNPQDDPITQEPPKPIYEVQLGDIKFSVQKALDLGNIIKAEKSYQEDLKTTEKFIWVVVGAQNKGKNNLSQYAWDLGNIVDSEGRNFVPITNQAYYWLPKPDLCGALLKPEFDAIPCTRVYEVSKISTGLKLQVIATPPDSTKKQSALLDLDVH